MRNERTMALRGFALGALALCACASGTGDGGPRYENPLRGTCLESMFECFQPAGSGTCQYDPASRLASLVFTNGAKVTSASGGSQDNRCFGPTGGSCFTVTKINDTVRSYRDTNQTTVTVTHQGENLLLQCPGGIQQSVAKPASNPAEEDLRRCVQ
jgi:hypothetical protein